MSVRVIEIHENIYNTNNNIAGDLRRELKRKGVFLLNVMSSPGSGKTTLLTKAINLLKEDYRIGAMDVDIKSCLDAQKVSDCTGVPVLQIHNGGLCHIDAQMTQSAIMEFESCHGSLDSKDGKGFDILFLENIGNLVCPAEFDTGAHKNMMILSVPEGEDKPLKYPLMFSVCDLVVISKIDTKDFFTFDEEKARKYILDLNPKATVISLSAKTGQGVSDFCSWIKTEIEANRMN